MLVMKEGSDNMVFYQTQQLPQLVTLKQKSILVLKTAMDRAFEYDDENTPANLVTMEVTKQVLENLQAICNDVFLPIMSNPKN